MHGILWFYLQYPIHIHDSTFVPLPPLRAGLQIGAVHLPSLRHLVDRI
jgi:hypothetical protein